MVRLHWAPPTTHRCATGNPVGRRATSPHRGQPWLHIGRRDLSCGYSTSSRLARSSRSRSLCRHDPQSAHLLRRQHARSHTEPHSHNVHTQNPNDFFEPVHPAWVQHRTCTMSVCLRTKSSCSLVGSNTGEPPYYHNRWWRVRQELLQPVCQRPWGDSNARPTA